MSQGKRLVGGDAVHSEVDHCLHVFLLVHGPDVHAHSEVVCLFHPFRMLVERAVMIVNAVDAVFVQVGRGNVAVQILVREFRCLRCHFLADVHAERDEDYLVRVIESMFFQLAEGDVHHLVLTFLAVLALELKNQHGGRAFCALLQVFVECRHALAVRKLELFQEIVGVFLNLVSLDAGIVMYHDLVVRCQVNVELAAPEAVVLCRFQ